MRRATSADSGRAHLARFMRQYPRTSSNTAPLVCGTTRHVQDLDTASTHSTWLNVVAPQLAVSEHFFDRNMSRTVEDDNVCSTYAARRLPALVSRSRGRHNIPMKAFADLPTPNKAQLAGLDVWTEELLRKRTCPGLSMRSACVPYRFRKTLKVCSSTS